MDGRKSLSMRAILHAIQFPNIRLYWTKLARISLTTFNEFIYPHIVWSSLQKKLRYLYLLCCKPIAHPTHVHNIDHTLQIRVDGLADLMDVPPRQLLRLPHIRIIALSL